MGIGLEACADERSGMAEAEGVAVEETHAESTGEGAWEGTESSE